MRRMLVTCGLLLFCLAISPYAEYSVSSGLTSLALTGGSSAAQNPRTANVWVQTDKFDYQPGETALISGGGFLPGEVVRLQVLHANGLNDGVGHDPFSTLTDLDGALSEQWYVHPDDSLHSLFILTAEGLTSGRRATAVFTDAFFFNPDDGGVDDINSNQVDLTRMGTDEVGLPTTLGIQFNWDDTAWTGGNTGDACALIDTDDPEDGMANFALCVKVAGNPAQYVSTSLFSCNNTRSDRCAGPTLLPAGGSSCGASIPLSSDPFTHGKGNVCNGPNCGTRDTVAACTVSMNDFASNSAFLINVCTFPSGEPNSNPFDCVITPDNGFLTIVKAGPPAGDTTPFVFNLGTSQESQNGTKQWTINGAGSQQTISFRPGSYDLLEAIPANWKLDSASCEVSNAGTGTGTTTPVPGAGNAGVTGFQILSGRETTCTFTNAKHLANLTLNKTVVNDNGGTASPGDFTLKIDANAVVQGQAQSLNAGSYVLSETGPAGYTAGSWSCTGFSAGGGSFNTNTNTVTLVAGENVTCGITNNDQPATLTVIKTVVNDNGGTAVSGDFTINVKGGSPSPSSFSGSASGTAVTINAGSYSVDENAVAGYTKNLSAGCSGTLAPGGSATCTITNTDDPATLIVIKTVVNNNGGTAASSAFTMTINGVTALGGNSFPGADAPGTSKTLSSVGAYTVTETGPAEYTASFSTDCSGTIALGQTKTCTITNDDAIATPAGSTVQRAILHDRFVISTGIRRGAGEGALTVTFRLYSDAGCNNQIGVDETVNFVFDSPQATSTSGSATTVLGVLVSNPGSYYWRATFSGNSFNQGFTTGCGSEITTVTFTQ